MSTENQITQVASLPGEMERKQPARFSAGLKIIKDLPTWLAGFIKSTRLTDQEQKEAGIDLNYQRNK